MIVHIETPKITTRKVFRDKEAAARFITRHSKDFVSVKQQAGRVIVLYRTHASQACWSRCAEESERARPTYKVALNDWPAKYR